MSLWPLHQPLAFEAVQDFAAVAPPGCISEEFGYMGGYMEEWGMWRQKAGVRSLGLNLNLKCKLEMYNSTWWVHGGYMVGI